MAVRQPRSPRIPFTLAELSADTTDNRTRWMLRLYHRWINAGRPPFDDWARAELDRLAEVDEIAAGLRRRHQRISYEKSLAWAESLAALL